MVGLDGTESWLSLVEKAELHMIQYHLEKRQNLQQTNRVLPFYVVSYTKSGSSRLHMNGIDYYAGPGDVLIIPPLVRHDHVKDTGEETEFLWWHFNLQIADTIDALSAFQFPVCFRLAQPDLFERVFHEYLRCATARRSFADVLMKSAKSLELVALIIDEALRHPDIRMRSDFSNEFARMLADLLNEPGSRSSLESLGQRYHMHPTYISNRFKKMFGITPIQLQKSLMLDKAKKLLETDGHTVGEVGLLVGYEDIDDFSRFFKSKMGLSPLEYRRQRNRETGRGQQLHMQ